MSISAPNFEQRLIDGEIRRYVAQAIEHRSGLSAPDYATRILETYPGCGLPASEIANQIMMAAAKSGVPVEFGRPMNATRLSRESSEA